MTGFGAGSAVLAAKPAVPETGSHLTIEIRAVNHRFLDLRVRAPEQLPHLVSVIEALARERLVRGRFDVTARFEGAASAIAIDKDRARTLFQSLRELRDELAPGQEVPLSLLASVPELFAPAIERDAGALQTALAAAFDQAKAALDEMRMKEGAILAEDFRRRLATLRTLMGAVSTRAPEVVESYRKRLAERVERLRSGSLDEGRLEQEVVLFADRTDIAEELTRLAGHIAHFDGILEGEREREPVGRRLDFLLQEMSREVNTIGAKGQDLAIAHAVVDLKTEIERIREQVQNVE